MYIVCRTLEYQSLFKSVEFESRRRFDHDMPFSEMERERERKRKKEKEREFRGWTLTKRVWQL